MELLALTARWELILVVVSFAAVTLWKLFKSANFTGLLRASDKTLSPGRIQLLVLTLLTAVQYLLATLQDPSRMPSLPTGLVAALGGSQAIYLGAKAWNMLNLKGNNSED
jgi:hypothetical protein